MSLFNALKNSILKQTFKSSFDFNTGSQGLFKYGVVASVIHSQIRTTTFFNKLPAEALWKGVTSVSNAGKKRGRGRGSGKKIAKDLNKGQIIGIGKVNMVWPGLTAPVIRGRELISQQKLPEDPDRNEKLMNIRNQMGLSKRNKLLPIERGWSGNKLPGRSIGPPDPVGEDMFEGFDTKVLELKTVFSMTGNMGRKRTISTFVVTGNKQGLAGFGLGKALDGKAALKSAKNRAGQRLMYFEMYNNHTVYHDFFAQFGKTKIFVTKKPKGYGLVCHRAIKCICEMIGITDLYAKIEGSTNVQNITKAFFVGLLQQKTHAELAEETGLNVVEVNSDKDYFPDVVATPSGECVKSEKPLDFQEYIMNGKVILNKKKHPVFYKKLPSWENHLKKTLRFRNQSKAAVHLLAENGSLKSFLSVPEEVKQE